MYHNHKKNHHLTLASLFSGSANWLQSLLHCTSHVLQLSTQWQAPEHWPMKPELVKQSWMTLRQPAWICLPKSVTIRPTDHIVCADLFLWKVFVKHHDCSSESKYHVTGYGHTFSKMLLSPNVLTTRFQVVSPSRNSTCHLNNLSCHHVPPGRPTCIGIRLHRVQ